MEMLFLLKNLYRDPLALSRFSQFRCLHISKGEIIQNLNETHEFQVCFVLKGSLCLFRDHIESMPLMAMQNEFFFISSLHQCKIKAMDDVKTFQIGKHFFRRFLLDTHFGLSALVLIIALVIGLCVFRRRKDW